MRRPRIAACFAVAVYLLAVLVSPVLHRLHHAQHGADHQHTALGTSYTHGDPASGTDDVDEAAHHAAFDTALVDLGLAEVATAGTITVDCAYAELTLATCDATATTTHPRTFGDDLLARTHRHSEQRPDPTHGLGSLEHLAASILATPTTSLPPPLLPFERVLVALQDASIPDRFRATYAARGPPRSL